jgi:RNase P/RNase MRP subunit POP5
VFGGSPLPVRTHKRRYLLFRIRESHSIGEDEVEEAIKGATHRLYGIKGLSQINPKLINYDPVKGEGIIYTRHTQLRRTRCALASITGWNGKEMAFQILKVSGTIKGLTRSR